jgi:excisionase family DNA binding protein
MTSHGQVERLLRAREVAEMLGVSMDWVLDRWQEGELPGFKLGGSPQSPVRFRLSEVEAWLEAHRGGSMVPPTRPLRLVR